MSCRFTLLILMTFAFIFSHDLIADELPPGIRLDRYYVEARQRFEERDYYGAKEALQQMIDIQQKHELALPSSFWFFHALVSARNGDYAASKESATRYLTTEGRAGEHYEEALKALVAAEGKLRGIEEAKRQAELKRQADEAARIRSEQLIQEQIAASKEPLRDTLRSHNGTGPELVRITGGRFWYCDGACNWIQIPPFAISKFEVTRAEFRRFVKATRYKTEARQKPKYGCYTYNTPDSRRHTGFDWSSHEYEQTEEHPVVCVSVNDAIEYTKWLSSETGHRYRLPYEAEWEFAFYSGSKYAAGFQIPYDLSVKEILSDSPQTDICTLGNHAARDKDSPCHDSRRYSVPVGRYPPNKVGIYDLFGNVGELTLTCAFTCPGDGSGCEPVDNPSWDVPFHRIPGCDMVGTKGYHFERFSGDDILYIKPFRNPYGYRRNSRTYIGFRVVRDL